MKEVNCCDTKKEFDERIDSLMVLMGRTCPFLMILVIHEPISTCSALLIAFSAKNLQRLYIRKSSVIVACDWPKNPDWEADFFSWLKTTAKSVNATEKEISQILGYNFVFLTEEAFKLLDVNVRNLSSY